MIKTGPAASEVRAPFLGATAAQLMTLALVAGATAARVWVGALAPGVLPFSFYFPVVLVAALAGGWPSAATALVTSTLVGWWLFLAPAHETETATFVNLLLYLFSAGCMALAGLYVRSLIQQLQAGSARLAARELQHRTLFDAISEGFALSEAIRGPDGRMVDFRILEANPAILRMLGLKPDIVGRTGGEVVPRAGAPWLAACERALKDGTVTFEFQGQSTGRWFEVHLTRVGPDLLAQVIVDVTHRKTAETRQSELFDELNHRVKNNLAMVSSMLSLQARMGDGVRVREHLDKAVDRIQAIAEVHGSLYRSGGKDEVDFGAYLQDLCARLSRSLLEGERVTIACHVEAAVMPLEKAVALGVVVNELVTNAAKHAFPPPAGGRIDVTLAHDAAGLLLSVSDDGQGLGADTPASGLGMRLVRSLVQQIGATLEVERHPGAAFRIRLAEAQARPAVSAAGGQARLF